MRWVACSAFTPITESCGPVMPGVGDRGCAARLHAGVSGLDVGVCADHGSDAPVEPARERDLLARRLGVDVDEHDRRRRAGLVDEVVHDLPHLKAGCSDSDPITLITATACRRPREQP